MTDLFSYTPLPSPARYPVAPGFKDRDTSRLAADSVAGTAGLLRERCRGLVAAAGEAGLTADEAAARLGETVLSVRPRFTELLRGELIKDSGKRRRNDSGRSAKVWVAA